MWRFLEVALPGFRPGTFGALVFGNLAWGRFFLGDYVAICFPWSRASYGR